MIFPPRQSTSSFAGRVMCLKPEVGRMMEHSAPSSPSRLRGCKLLRSAILSRPQHLQRHVRNMSYLESVSSACTLLVYAVGCKVYMDMAACADRSWLSLERRLYRLGVKETAAWDNGFEGSVLRTGDDGILHPIQPWNDALAAGVGRLRRQLRHSPASARWRGSRRRH